MNDLRQAAQAVMDQWDSPRWKWSQQGPTADLMAALRTALEQQQAEPVAQSDLVKRLRETASKGVSVWGDLQMEAAREIEILRAERDCYASAMDKMLAASRAEPIGWLDGNDKLAEFMHRDLKADHDKRGSATPREFTVPVYTAPLQQQAEPVTCGYDETTGNCTRELCCRAALEQQQAEPVYRKGCAECGRAKQVQEDDDEWKADLAKGREILARQSAPQQQAEPVACKTLCELCVKRGYDFCANVAKTTPIIISPTPPQQQAEPVQETKAFGFVTVRRLSQRFENHHDQYQFYPAGQIPYLDNVDECHTVYTAPPQRKPPTCAWSPEDDDTMPGTYRSACGELWSFIDGSWKDNRVNFCHGCGGKVIEAAHGIKEGA